MAFGGTCVTVDLDFSGGHPAGAHLVLGAVRVCSMSAAWWLADASPPAPLGMPCPGGAQFRFAQTWPAGFRAFVCDELLEEAEGDDEPLFRF